MNAFGKHGIASVLTVLTAAMSLTAGCERTGQMFGGASSIPVANPTKETTYQRIETPKPVNLLLPRKINIHPFTVTRTFDKAGGIRGVDVRIEVFNAFREATRAFGSFRFELYTYKANSQQPRGDLRGIWEIEPSLLDAGENKRYWNRSQQMYEFKLQWDKPIPVGKKFVLAAVFTSPFTKRLTAQRIFISGE